MFNKTNNHYVKMLWPSWLLFNLYDHIIYIVLIVIIGFSKNQWVQCLFANKILRKNNNNELKMCHVEFRQKFKSQ